MTSTTIPTTTTFRSEESIALADAPAQRRSFTVTGWVITGLVSAFMTFDAAVHLIQPAALVTPENSMGITSNALAVTGVLAVAIVALYLVPRTATLGTVLLTSYLGGAIATHMINQSPLFASTLFPVYLGIVAWAGTWLRSPAVRSLMPFSRRSA